MKEKQVDMQQNVLITNIQRFSLHDGPGIRTTVFLKGCSLQCPWCANPENISGQKENYEKDGQQGIYGRYISCDELYDILLRDELYYDGGGVTFSGGEPLVQIEKMEPLLKRLKDKGIHICFETALFVKKNNMITALDYADFFYVDVKYIEQNACREIIGGDVELFMQNFRLLRESEREFAVRIPIISKYTNEEKNIDSIISFLGQNRIREVELLQEHHLGFPKYESLGRPLPQLYGMEMEEMEELRDKFIAHGIDAIICHV